MIYSIHEGIIDSIKSAYKKSAEDRKNLRNHNVDRMIKRRQDRIDSKNNRTTTNSKESDRKSTMFTEEQYTEIMKAAGVFFNKYLPKFIQIAKQEISKSELCKKHFKLHSSSCNEDDFTLMIKDEYNNGYKYPAIIFSSFLSYNLWDIEPKARTDYDISENIKEAFDIHNSIKKAIYEYCNNANIKGLKIDDDGGDWDSIIVDIYIPLDTIYLMKESSIFESVKFI